jgi:hypothetical protein
MVPFWSYGVMELWSYGVMELLEFIGLLGVHHKGVIGVFWTLWRYGVIGVFWSFWSSSLVFLIEVLRGVIGVMELLEFMVPFWSFSLRFLIGVLQGFLIRLPLRVPCLGSSFVFLFQVNLWGCF